MTLPNKMSNHYAAITISTTATDASIDDKYSLLQHFQCLYRVAKKQERRKLLAALNQSYFSVFINYRLLSCITTTQYVLSQASSNKKHNNSIVTTFELWNIYYRAC